MSDTNPNPNPVAPAVTPASVRAQLLTSPVFTEEAERTDWLEKVLPQLDAAGLAQTAALLTQAAAVQAAAQAEELRLLTEQQRVLQQLLHKAKAALLQQHEGAEQGGALAELARVESRLAEL